MAMTNATFLINLSDNPYGIFTAVREMLLDGWLIKFQPVCSDGYLIIVLEKQDDSDLLSIPNRPVAPEPLAKSDG